MYNYVRAIGNDNTFWYQVGITYFTAIVTCGNIFLFSIFIAILLENFENDMKEQIDSGETFTILRTGTGRRKSIFDSAKSQDFWIKVKEGFKKAFLGRREK